MRPAPLQPLPTSPSPRLTPTPPATTTPPAMITPSTITIASATTTSITSPRHGATVGQKVAVEGVLAGLRPEQQVFVCVESQAFGRPLYPLGQVMPDCTGQWTVGSTYGTPGD